MSMSFKNATRVGRSPANSKGRPCAFAGAALSLYRELLVERVGRISYWPSSGASPSGSNPSLPLLGATRVIPFTLFNMMRPGPTSG